MTGHLWRLMTSSCQSSSHRESRALPSAPKLMGRRQGGEVTQPRAAGRGEKEWWSEHERQENGGAWSKAGRRARTGKLT